MPYFKHGQNVIIFNSGLLFSIIQAFRLPEGNHRTKKAALQGSVPLGTLTTKACLILKQCCSSLSLLKLNLIIVRRAFCIREWEVTYTSTSVVIRTHINMYMAIKK